MVIAETRIYDLGRYTIQQRPRPDNPYWAVYMVFRGEKLIGRQFSVPTISDCAWLDRQKEDEVRYASSSAPLPPFKLRGVAKRGRPTKAEQARRAAAAHIIEVAEEIY